MKKESNAGLFFLLAVGIVGLGLYFGAAEDYSRGELQLYHIVCWAVLIAALLRVLELVWEPVARYGILTRDLVKDRDGSGKENAGFFFSWE